MYSTERAQVETTMGYIVVALCALLLLSLTTGLVQVGRLVLAHWVG